MNADIEKPKINPLIYNKNIFAIIPIMVKPNIQITNEYDKLLIILFLKARILLMVWLSIFDINNSILSMTSFLSLKSIILANIAPDVTPKNNIAITKKLIFLLGNIIFLILLNLFIIVSPS